jgi:ribonuclease BN (tRNA processing enzyme)
VLTHFSARIKDANMSLSEANKVGEGSPLSITFANDGDRVHLHTNGHVTHRSWSQNGWTA